MSDQVKEMLQSLDAFKSRVSESQKRLGDIASGEKSGRDEPQFDPREKFLQALDASENRAAKLDREIAEIESMLKFWLDARDKPGA